MCFFFSILTWDATDHSHKPIAFYNRIHCAVVNTFESNCLICIQLIFEMMETEKEI